jgi:uncharacterized membrane protein YbhN (UPF0104 family)
LNFRQNHRTNFPFRRVIQWAIVVTIFVFLGRMVWENWSQVKEASFNFRPFHLALSTLFFVLWYVTQIWAWYLITVKLGIAISLRETLESWFYSQLGKYLPGKVWLLLGRYYFYESKGKSRGKISIALYLEVVTVLLAAGLLSAIGTVSFREANAFRSNMEIWWAFLLLIIVFLSLYPKFLQKILNWILILFRKEPIILSISYRDISWILLVCILSWIIGGIGFWIFVDSVFAIPSQHILFLTGALALSSTLGLIALFAPSGLGVREGVLVYLLSHLMPGGVAVIISVLTRIWMTLVEIGLIGVIYLSGQFHKGLEKRGQHVKS